MYIVRKTFVALAAIGIIGITGAFSTAPAAANSLNAQLAAVRQCTGNCIMPCQGSGSAYENVPGTTYGMGQHGCEVIALDCAYHQCSISQAAPVAVDVPRMVAAHDLRGLLDGIPTEQLVFVPERGVLQVLAECGSVVAQLPVTATEMRALE